MDISKFFANIWCLNFLNAPFDVISPRLRKGLPIGNLTSQLFANMYLNELDQFVKHKLHVRWYARYMDDFLIIHPDKAYLHTMKAEIQTFLQEKLHLTLSERKVILSNVKNGVPFVGYRIFYDHNLIRGKTLSRMQKKLTRRRKAYKYGTLSTASYRSSRASICGHIRHANSFQLRKKLALWK